MNLKIIIGDSRSMNENKDHSIDLIITSPPYWQIKDYENVKQIGFGQNLHEYLKDLYRVWEEGYRVLKPGRRLCINIGDQFARSIIYGRYKIIPLHSECISQCENIGFDFMGSIIWQKKTTLNTTGGATIMGSFPYPPNGMVEIDYEHILIFKKPGESIKQDIEIKKKSEITKEEWKEYFSGHWNFGGVKQIEHQAMFPDELPKRLIKMFSFYGETVLDPFLGSGTTAKAALELNRNAVGYEINSDYLSIIKNKVGFSENQLISNNSIQEIFQKNDELIINNDINYKPNVQDANFKIDPKLIKFKNNDRTYKVVSIENNDILILDTGLKVKLLGIIFDPYKMNELKNYLNKFVLKKEIILKFDKKHHVESKDMIHAYVYLKNKIFINSYIIKSGLAKVDISTDYEMKSKFVTYISDNGVNDGKGMDIKQCDESLPIKF
ncbi:MAG TPA: DNA methyltransferase [Spirochaetota bacterium]|nr:DNA methyltransferase [Spirochaetota bacterium]